MATLDRKRGLDNRKGTRAARIRATSLACNSAATAHQKPDHGRMPARSSQMILDSSSIGPFLFCLLMNIIQLPVIRCSLCARNPQVFSLRILYPFSK
jgi:hypothetical protein